MRLPSVFSAFFPSVYTGLLEMLRFTSLAREPFLRPFAMQNFKKWRQNFAQNLPLGLGRTFSDYSELRIIVG